MKQRPRQGNALESLPPGSTTLPDSTAPIERLDRRYPTARDQDYTHGTLIIRVSAALGERHVANEILKNGSEPEDRSPSKEIPSRRGLCSEAREPSAQPHTHSSGPRMPSRNRLGANHHPHRSASGMIPRPIKRSRSRGSDHGREHDVTPPGLTPRNDQSSPSTRRETPPPHAPEIRPARSSPPHLPVGLVDGCQGPGRVQRRARHVQLSQPHRGAELVLGLTRPSPGNAR